MRRNSDPGRVERLLQRAAGALGLGPEDDGGEESGNDGQRPQDRSLTNRDDVTVHGHSGAREIDAAIHPGGTSGSGAGGGSRTEGGDTGGGSDPESVPRWQSDSDRPASTLWTSPYLRDGAVSSRDYPVESGGDVPEP